MPPPETSSARSGPLAARSLDEFVGNPQWYEAEEWTRPDEMAMFTNVWKAVRRQLDTRDQATVLDLCCGTGMSLLGAVSHLSLREFVGVDIENRAVTFARQRFSAFPSYAFYCDDAATFTLAGSGHHSADVIILSSAYHHMPDDRKVVFLKNVGANLAAGGCVVVAENILPEYESHDDASYLSSVRRFYSGVVKTLIAEFPATSDALLALIESNVTLAAAKREEFKVSMPVFLSDVSAARLTVHQTRQVWSSPEGPSPSWGNFLFELGHAAPQESV